MPSRTKPQLLPQIPALRNKYLLSVPTLAFIPLFVDWNGIINNLLNTYALGLLNLVINLFTGLLEKFLFPAPPGTVGGLDALYDQMVFVFFAIVSVTSLTYFGYSMLFPYDEQADPFRFVNRFFAGVVGVIIGKPLLNLAFDAVTALGQFIYPNNFHLEFAGQAGTGLLANAGDIVLTGVTFYIGLILMNTISFASIAILLGILAVRALLIYTAYAMFPLFLGLWVVDIGPLKYGKIIGDVGFKIFALLLAFGVIIAAILATGGAIAGWGPDPPDSNVEEFAASVGEEGEAATASMSTPIISIMAFFGSLWASIAITQSALGMLTSIRGNSGPSMGRRASGTVRGSRGESGLKGRVQGAAGGFADAGKSSGGAGSYGANAPDSAGEYATAQPESISGRVNQFRQDYANADGAAEKGFTVTAGAFGAGKSALTRMNNSAKSVANGGNTSIADGALGAMSRTKSTVENAPGKLNQMRSGSAGSVKQVRDAGDALDGERINMNAVTYDEANSRLVDDAGYEMDYEDPNGNGPNLEDGKRYDLSGADIETQSGNNPPKVRAHSGMQATERRAYPEYMQGAAEGTQSAIDYGKSAASTARDKAKDKFK